MRLKYIKLLTNIFIYAHLHMYCNYSIPKLKILIIKNIRNYKKPIINHYKITFKNNIVNRMNKCQ